MKTGTIIILNCGSSYGKTSLAKTLQDLLEVPALLMGIDLFWFTLPTKQVDLDQVEPQYYRWEIVGSLDKRSSSSTLPLC